MEKIVIAKEVVVNCDNFNPIGVKHASIHIKKYGTCTQVAI
jgi:hypothetical protein